MKIIISNLTIASDAPAGTIIGVLTTRDETGNEIPCNYALTKGSVGNFAISGDKLVASWAMPPVVGYYAVRIRAIGISALFNGSAWFTVNVAMSALPPPPPPPPPPVPSITVNGSTDATVTEGAALAIAVGGNPGNTTDWVGLATFGAPDTSVFDWVYLSGSRTPPAVGTTSATVTMKAPTTDAPYEARLYVNNSWTVLARSKFTVQGAAPPPPEAPQPEITVTPNDPQISDTTPRGAVVAAFSVVMTDGSPFNGTVGFGAPNFDGGGVFALSGNNIIVSPTGPGVGPNLTTITDHITLEALS
jgi:hypothetical protein